MPRGYRIPYEENHRVNKNNEIEKLCSICGEWLLMNENNYYINKKNKTDGYYPNCIACEIQRTRNWRKDNPEWYKELNHITNTNPSDKTRETYRRNSKNRRENGKYYEWLANNPDKILKHAEDRRHKNHRITKEEWEACKSYFNNCCAYCGFPAEEHYRMIKGAPRKEDLHKEHVDHEGSSDLSNCVPSCQDCNNKKWSFEFNYWYNKNNINYTNERYNKIINWITEEYKKYIQPTKPKQKYVRKIKQETA